MDFNQLRWYVDGKFNLLDGDDQPIRGDAVRKKDETYASDLTRLVQHLFNSFL